MKSRSQAEDWVQALRTFIRDNLGNQNWQIVEKKAGKTALGIRFEDGTRIFKYIPYKWQRTSANEIKHFIEAVHYLHIKKKVPFEEAFERTKSRVPKGNILPKNKLIQKYYWMLGRNMEFLKLKLLEQYLNRLGIKVIQKLLES